MNRIGPSKKFLIRGGIATAIVVVILVVQSTWFKTLFHKTDSSKVSPDTTIGELVEKDSNANGIPDWEERLWGLDPTVLYTNGMSNKEIIESKKQSLGITDSSSTIPLTETDKLARDLYSLSIALGQSNVDNSTLDSIGAKLASSIPIKDFENTYTFKDIKTAKTTTASLLAYQSALNKTIDKYQSDAPGFEIVIGAIENGDYSQVATLGDSALEYAALANGLRQVLVPIGVAQDHLDIINGLAGMAKSFTYLKELDSDTVEALSGIAIYKASYILYSTAITDMGHYFQRYGILNQ